VLVEDSVASVLADVTQALLPCSHTECCELSDDAAFASARAVYIFFTNVPATRAKRAADAMTMRLLSSDERCRE
jgi:hypothetical protein